jgi:hypothetical protein
VTSTAVIPDSILQLGPQPRALSCCGFRRNRHRECPARLLRQGHDRVPAAALAPLLSSYARALVLNGWSYHEAVPSGRIARTKKASPSITLYLRLLVSVMPPCESFASCGTPLMSKTPPDAAP